MIGSPLRTVKPVTQVRNNGMGLLISATNQNERPKLVMNVTGDGAGSNVSRS
jgi:hypothetical protein